MGKKFKNKELAARLGVSGTLVSLVLNNKGDQHGIKKETQEKVLAVARQMGYFTTLREKEPSVTIEEKPGIIGMIVPSLNDPVSTGIAPYMHKAFASIGMGFTILTKDPDDSRYERMISAFKKFFSGLILVGKAADDYTIRNLRSADFPFVILESSCLNLRLNSVCSDIIAGCKLVAEHVHSLSYKNIAILTDSENQYGKKAVIEQLKSSLSEVAETKKIDLVQVEKLPGEEEYNFSQVESLLRPPHRIELFLVTEVALLHSLFRYFAKKTRRIPQDFAVISLEDGPGLDLIHPPVTTLRKAYPAMAIKASNILWSEIKNSGKSKYKRQVTIPPDLIKRASCGNIS